MDLHNKKHPNTKNMTSESEPLIWYKCVANDLYVLLFLLIDSTLYLNMLTVLRLKYI